MKFQNPSLNFFLNGRKDGRTNERTSRNQYAPHFFKVGGIKTTLRLLTWGIHLVPELLLLTYGTLYTQ